MSSAVTQRQFHIVGVIREKGQAGVGCPVPMEHEVLAGEVDIHWEAPAEGGPHPCGQFQPQAAVLHASLANRNLNFVRKILF